MLRSLFSLSLFLNGFIAAAQLVGSTFEEATLQGKQRSSYLNQKVISLSSEAPKANLEAFHQEIEPLLEKTCYPCHGPDKQKGDFRIDTLNPNLVEGGDELWWLDVMDVVTNGEMPPDDADVSIADEERGDIVDWLTNEVHVASQVRRSEHGHSSFRHDAL